MEPQYHERILQRALLGKFSPLALQVIISANKKQDGWRGQIGHPEYHFDDNAIEQAQVYIDQQQEIVLRVLKSYKEEGKQPEKIELAWKALGRLTHTAQDYYAHSNYVALWIASISEGKKPPPEKIEPRDMQIMTHPDLHTGRVYPLELISYVIPFLKPLAKLCLPGDAHLHHNLDAPDRGPLFDYAFVAALKRTQFEFERIAEKLNLTQLERFSGGVIRPKQTVT